MSPGRRPAAVAGRGGHGQAEGERVEVGDAESGNEQLALGALHAARALGLAVPAQLSVTGFDDIPAAATADPPLTTIRQPLRERGQAIGTLIAALIAGVAAGPLPPVTEFGTELVVRASTAPVQPK